MKGKLTLENWITSSYLGMLLENQNYIFNAGDWLIVYKFTKNTIPFYLIE